MKQKNISLLIISLILCFGTMIINRLIVSVPDWIAYIVLVISGISLLIYILRNTVYKSKDKR